MLGSGVSIIGKILGSGATAALDLMVMNSGWGSNIFVAEQSGGGMSTVWFNQSAGDEMKCINGSSTANPNGSLIGGVGYASADQAVGVANISQNVTQLKYNGYYPTRTTIRNGQYDFYSDAWLYTNPANSATANAIAASLAAFAQNPASVPADSINYWAARGEMKFDRLYDSSYPGFIGASNPQLP